MSTYSETLREIRSARRAARIPLADLAPARGALHGVGVTLPLAIGAATGHAGFGSLAALGAMPAGIAALFGHTAGRRSTATALLAALGMAVAAFVGAVAAAHTVLMVCVIALFAYTAGIVVAFSDRVAAAALQWPVSLLIATVLPETPARAAGRAGFVLAGGLLQTALAAVADARAGSVTARPRRRPRDFARHLAATIRTHLGAGTEHGRHALRMVAAAVAAQGAAMLAGLAHPYWAALTAVVVLKSDHVLTVRRGLDRIGGTALGVVLGMLLAVLAERGTGLLLAEATVVTVLAYTVFAANYLLFSAFLTGFVVLLLDLLGNSARETAGARLLATLLGGAIALAASHLRPPAVNRRPTGPLGAGLPAPRRVR
jgi:hypothetical protein